MTLHCTNLQQKVNESFPIYSEVGIISLPHKNTMEISSESTLYQVPLQMQ